MDAIFQWMNATEGVMSWIASAVAIATAVGGWLIFVKVKKLHEHPIVKPSLWAVAFATTGAAVGIAVDRYVSVRSVIGAHAKNEVEPDSADDTAANKDGEGDKKPGDVKADPPEEKSIVVTPPPKKDEAVEPARHVAAKPIIVDGKASHKNQALSQFKPAEIAGYFRCKKCNQLGSLQMVGNSWQFIEAELAPEPIFMK